MGVGRGDRGQWRRHAAERTAEVVVGRPKELWDERVVERGQQSRLHDHAVGAAAGDGVRLGDGLDGVVLLLLAELKYSADSGLLRSHFMIGSPSIHISLPDKLH